MTKRFIVTAIAICFIAAPWISAGGEMPHHPQKKDKCPVCGMFVYKYPDWVAQVRFADETTVFFDGAKDMFKYLFHLPKYRRDSATAAITAIWVTDYYDLKPIEARGAHFVIGSDIFGPMGKELIPFKTGAAAEEFKHDHGGTQVLTFDQVTQAVVETLD